jgi:hypothetical protein
MTKYLEFKGKNLNLQILIFKTFSIFFTNFSLILIRSLDLKHLALKKSVQYINFFEKLRFHVKKVLTLTRVNLLTFFNSSKSHSLQG